MSQPPTTTPPATNQYKLSNVAGIAAASGYNKQVLNLYGLNQSTKRNYLLQSVRNTTVRKSGKTSLMAAVISGNLPEVQRILHNQGHRKDIINKQVKDNNYGPRTALDFAIKSICFKKNSNVSNRNHKSEAAPEKNNVGPNSQSLQQLEPRIRILQTLINHPNIEISRYFLSTLICLSPGNKKYPDQDYHNLLDRIIQKLVRTQTTNKNSILFKEILNHDIVLENLLNIAISYGYLDLVRILVEELHVDVNRKYLPPLKEAIYTGNKEIIQYLIQHGADIHAYDDNEYNGFLIIALNSYEITNNLEFLKFLIEQVGINHATEINKAFARESERYYPGPPRAEILEYLVSKGATPSSTTGGRRKTRKNKSKKRKASRRSKQ